MNPVSAMATVSSPLYFKKNRFLSKSDVLIADKTLSTLGDTLLFRK